MEVLALLFGSAFLLRNRFENIGRVNFITIVNKLGTKGFDDSSLCIYANYSSRPVKIARACVFKASIK